MASKITKQDVRGWLSQGLSQYNFVLQGDVASLGKEGINSGNLTEYLFN